jgi:SAM-dependent methyltransferase
LFAAGRRVGEAVVQAQVVEARDATGADFGGRGANAARARDRLASWGAEPRAVVGGEDLVRIPFAGTCSGGVVEREQTGMQAKIDARAVQRAPHAVVTPMSVGAAVGAGVDALGAERDGKLREFVLGQALANDQAAAERPQRAVQVGEAFEHELGSRSRGVPAVDQARIDHEHRRDRVGLGQCRRQRRVIRQSQVPAQPHERGAHVRRPAASSTTRPCLAHRQQSYPSSRPGLLDLVSQGKLRVVDEPQFDFDEVFDRDYLYFYGLQLDESDGEADAIWRLLELEPGMEVLDLACGHGRIANRLAQRGARVAGLDATPLFLDRARNDAAERRVEVEYVEGDMRSLPWPDGRFDRVFSWFTSFGYFDDLENRRVLREARRSLRPGGRLLIENNNLAELLPRWLPSVVIERDGDLMIDRPRFDPTTARANTERTVVRGGRVRRFHFSVRMFIAAELRDWLMDAGFTSVAFCDWAGEPLSARSRRMVTIATA